MFQRSLAQDGAGPSRDSADTEEVGAEAKDEDFNPDTEVRGKGKVEQESDEEKIVPKRRKKKIENSPEEPVRRKKKVDNSIEEPSGRKKKVRNAPEVPFPLPEVPLRGPSSGSRLSCAFLTHIMDSSLALRPSPIGRPGPLRAPVRRWPCLGVVSRGRVSSCRSLAAHVTPPQRGWY